MPAAHNTFSTGYVRSTMSMRPASLNLKPGSQYDAGATSIVSVMSIAEKAIFFTSQNCIQSFDYLIDWMLANTHDATCMLE